MTATLRCSCERCHGEIWTDVAEFLDAHPNAHQFMLLEVNGRPYQTSPKFVQGVLDWSQQEDT